MTNRNASCFVLFTLFILGWVGSCPAQGLNLSFPEPPSLSGADSGVAKNDSASLPTPISTESTHLREFEAEAWQEYEIQLTDLRPIERSRAALKLAALKSAAEPALDTLLVCLEDEDSMVRMNVAQAIGAIERNIVVSIEKLLPLLSDEDEHVRYAAERAIAQLSVRPIPKREIPRMLDALNKARQIVVYRDHHVGHRTVV